MVYKVDNDTEINEKDSVQLGNLVYDKDEYINVIYPEMKRKARNTLKVMQKGATFSFMTDVDDLWETRLVFGILGAYGTKSKTHYVRDLDLW